jgi:hypothetical protein
MISQAILTDYLELCEDEKNNISIKSKIDVSKGTLILLEHVFSAESKNVLFNTLMFCKDSLMGLYPRIDNNIIYDSDDLLSKTTREKVDSNIFTFVDHNDPMYLIGDTVSKFNHSCTPNCHVLPAFNSKYLKIIGVWTLKDIFKGEEFLIDYSTVKLDRINCLCTDEEHDKKNTARNITTRTNLERDTTMIGMLMDAYKKTKICENLVLKQTLAKKGIHEFDEKIFRTPPLERDDDYLTIKKRLESKIKHLNCDF